MFEMLAEDTSNTKLENCSSSCCITEKITYFTEYVVCCDYKEKVMHMIHMGLPSYFLNFTKYNYWGIVVQYNRKYKKNDEFTEAL